MEPNLSTGQCIEKLCDIVPNAKRTNLDFKILLDYLDGSPKDCIPFKGKILNHLNLHAHLNPLINPVLISACYAKATILFRKTANKDEGPLGAWKEGFRKEIKNLEDNIDQLYQLIGVTTNRIVGHEGDLKNQDDMETQETLPEDESTYRENIGKYIEKIRISSDLLCALISVKTEFDIPIPVFVLLRMASKICLIRCRDYKKNQNSQVREYVYSKTPTLIQIGLRLFKSTITVLGTNVIPFMPFYTQSLLRMLEWTRSSNIEQASYHSLRTNLLAMLNFTMEQLSLGINLEPQLLKSLIDLELVKNLEDLDELKLEPHRDNEEKHALEALRCIENVVITYSKFLEESLERKIKSYVIQRCIQIYRDFGSTSNTISDRENYRYQLLILLQTIANQPHATSTTEISHNVFELALKYETGSIKSLARRSLSVGLAHRPTIVSRYDVYNVYNRPMLDRAEPSNCLNEAVNELQQVEPEEQAEKLGEQIEISEEQPREPVEQLGKPVEQPEEPIEQSIRPDELVKEPGERAREPSGQVGEPDGQVTEPDGQVTEPDRQVTEPGEHAKEPEEQAREPDGQVRVPGEHAKEPDDQVEMSVEQVKVAAEQTREPTELVVESEEQVGDEGEEEKERRITLSPTLFQWFN